MKGNFISICFIAILLLSGCQTLKLDNIVYKKEKKFKYSAFHIAVRLNNIENVKLLLNKKDLNIKDPFGDYPLTDAIRNNSTEISKLLICNGANIKTIDRNSYSLIDIAVRNNNNDIIKLLKSKNINSSCGSSYLAMELKKLENSYTKFNKEKLAFTFEKNPILSNSTKNQFKLFINKLFNILNTRKNLINQIEIINYYNVNNNKSTSISQYLEKKKISLDNSKNITKYINEISIYNFSSILKPIAISTNNDTKIELQIILKD